jgi:hypothetical protein
MLPQVYVGGRAISPLVNVSELVLTHAWPTTGLGGPLGAECSVLLKASERPGWIEQGALSEVRLGGLPLVAGHLGEPDWIDGTLTIDAASTEGDQVPCLDSSGKTSSTPDTVFDAQIANGSLTWSRPASISTTALVTGDTTEELNNVTDMIGAYQDSSGARLYVDAWRRIIKGSDPTAPGLFVLPGAGELAWTTETQATRIIGRWADSSNGGKLTNTTVIAATEKKVVPRIVDMRSLGPITSARATAVLNEILAEATAGGWTNGLTLSPGHILNAPHLGSVANSVGRGLMVRLLGQRDTRPGRMPVGYVDFIVERSEWHVADDQIVLTPRGMVARDFAAILADAGVEEAA